MQKSSNQVKNKKKLKNVSFFTRVTSLFIIAAAIIVSAFFSFNYLDKNSNLSIEFAGGYQAQVKYDGIYHENSKTQNVVDLLENRVDPLGTSNIKIEKSNSTDNYYNLSISKSTGIDLSIFINNIARRGYVYLLDKDGHDLLANDFTASSKSWTAKTSRIVTKDAFSKISQSVNFNSGQPEVVFTVGNQNLLKTIQEVMKETNDGVYFYSDIGGLLNYVRNTWTGLQDLVKFIDEADAAKKPALKALLANETSRFGDDTGDLLYNAVKISDKSLINLLDTANHGVYSVIKWKYNDTFKSIHPLSVDSNNKENVFDPANPFDPKSDKGSPLNAWLPYIKDLIILPEISKALETAVVNYKYAPYYIGSIAPTSINANKLTINDYTFNKEKVQQIVNVLNAGTEENNFTVTSILNIDPTLGAKSLEIAVIGLLVALLFLSIALIFNYRLLGFIAVFVIILFLVLTLVTFTFLNNILAPETGMALIIGFALLLDTIISLFNALQKEYQSGKTIFDAFKAANKKSLVSAFDCSLVVLIVSLTIFWFGTRSIRGFAIMTSISTFGVILLGVLFLRFIIYLLLKNNVFEKRANLLALNQNKFITNNQEPNDSSLDDNSKKNKKTKFSLTNIKTSFIKTIKLDQKSNLLHISQWNFWNKATKWIIVAFGVIFLASGITYLSAGLNSGSGFEKRIDFIGETTAKDQIDPDFDLWEQANDLRDEVEKVLQNNKMSYQKIYSSLKLDGLDRNQNVLRVVIETNVSALKADDFRQFLDTNSTLSWIYTTNSALSGNELFKDMLIVVAISLITIFIYVIVRFQITFAVPLIVALIFAIFATLAVVTLLQITISTMTIGVILALVILVLINSVVIFDNIKEIKLNNFEKRNNLEKNEIIAISNEGIKKSLSRTLAVNSIIMLTALIVLCFLPSFWAVSLAIIVGTIVTFVATHFLSPYLWTFFERWRIKRYNKRLEKIKENFVGPDEYIIEGIND